MQLLAGLILFSVLGAWLSARQRAAGAALAFGVIGTVLFCTTPLGAQLPALVNGLVQGTAGVGAQVVDGKPQGDDGKPAEKHRATEAKAGAR